jgi:hypothetical protein
VVFQPHFTQGVADLHPGYVNAYALSEGRFK